MNLVDHPWMKTHTWRDLHTGSKNGVALLCNDRIMARATAIVLITRTCVKDARLAIAGKQTTLKIEL